MACIKVIINRVLEKLKINTLSNEVSKINTTILNPLIIASTNILNNYLKISITTSLIGAEINLIKDTIKVNCGIVCSIDKDTKIIRFSKSGVNWESNEQGVEKYNTLFASAPWGLEDYTIEDLFED